MICWVIECFDRGGKVSQILEVGENEIAPEHNEDMSGAIKWTDNLILSIFHSSSQGILILGATGYIEFFNKTYCKMFGVNEEANAPPLKLLDHIVNLWKKNIFADDDVNSMGEDEFCLSVVEIIKRSHLDPQLIKLRGEKYVNFNCRMIEGSRQVFTFSDITHMIMQKNEFRQARLQSENSLADLNTAINNTDVGLVLLDKDMNTLIINQAFNVIWNTRFDNFPENLTFRALMDVNRSNNIYNVDDENWEDYVQSRLSEIREGQIEPREFIRADGKILIYGCTALSGGQRLVRYTDITEFKRREADNERAKQLAQSLEAEKTLNALQRQFVSMASHEFRTPLAIIDGTAQRIQARCGKFDPADTVRRTEKIRSAVVRMTKLMESTLSAAQMEEGKLTVDIQDCKIHEILVSVCGHQQELADKHEIICKTDPLPPTIMVDPDAFEQMLTNLLSNAVKYSPKDPLIEVYARTAGENLLVSVSDSGLGIDKRDLPRMFERFFRAETSIGIAGTGIGLNLTKMLIELHGGSLKVKSELGVGSTFTMILPIAGPQTEMPAETLKKAAG